MERNTMVSYEDILATAKRIENVANHTPVLTSRTLNHMANGQVFLKCENFQRVGAFKFRGAVNALMQLSDAQKNQGVITHSSGNHAQALALASQLLDIQATIVMPKNSPKVKVRATRDTYGARVIFCENTVQSRHETCDAIMEKEGQTLIHPYDNDHIIAGAGTAALELLREIPDLDVIFTPVGGGGLLSGSAIATHGFNPDILVYAGEPERADDAYRSMLSGQIELNEYPDTIADGLRTHLCDRTFAIIREHVTEIITVSEQEILEAMRLVWERMKLIIEPSSAVPIAAILSEKFDLASRKVGVIISGGNLDLNQFFSLLEKNIS
ncbi:MAG: pyridoxal-phosphate dependent enzyme [Promethearchaeota archaeon]